MTDELRYRYQVEEKSLSEILQRDSKILMEMSQPSLVNEQLNQLCCDCKFENLVTGLNLGELKDYNEDSDDQRNKSQCIAVFR